MDLTAHERQLRELAQAARIPKPDAKSTFKFPGYGVLVKEAGGKAAFAAWRGCSSMAHGDVRGASLLTRETVGSRDGVVTMRLAGPSVNLLGLLTGQAVALIDQGFALYERLAAGPERSSPP